MGLTRRDILVRHNCRAQAGTARGPGLHVRLRPRIRGPDSRDTAQDRRPPRHGDSLQVLPGSSRRATGRTRRPTGEGAGERGDVRTPTWIWSVAVDGVLYVRAYDGHQSRWHQAAVRQRAGRIIAAGLAKEVAFETVEGPINDLVDEAYRKKYRGSPYLDPMTRAKARSAPPREAAAMPLPLSSTARAVGRCVMSSQRRQSENRCLRSASLNETHPAIKARRQVPTTSRLACRGAADAHPAGGP